MGWALGWLAGLMFPDMRLPVASRRRSIAVLLAVALGAAACGATDESSAPTLATDAPAAEAPSTEGAETAPDEPVPADEPSEGESTSEVAAENLFPDVDVLNIADGSTVNLAAELGGGDKATLLWFWAPH